MIASRKHVTRSIAASTAAIIVFLANGCGASDNPGGGVAQGTSSTGQGGAGMDGNNGTITLTVDGKASSFDSGQCRIVKTSDVNLSINTHDLHAVLPPKPGAFTEEDHSTVILPPPPGDEFRNTREVHGQWNITGERANGHVEGVAHLLSGVGSADDPAIPFSFDFDCPLTDLTAG